MVLLQQFSHIVRVHCTTQRMVIILAYTPHLALAADGSTGGIPLWVYPAGLLLIMLGLKFVQGDGEATKRKRRPANRRKTTRHSVSRQTEKPSDTPQAATPIETPIIVAERRPIVDTPIKDALEDAQDYIDRERYGEASIILKGAIQQTPERTDLQLKLLEIYARQHDEAAFEALYQRIVAMDHPADLLVANSLRPLLTQETLTASDSKQGTPGITDFAMTGALPTLTSAVYSDPNKQSLAALEAEFGIQPQVSDLQKASTSPEQHPTTAKQALEFDLGDYAPTPLTIVDRTALSKDAHTPEAEHAGNLMDFEAIKPYNLIEPEPAAALTMPSTETWSDLHTQAQPLSIDMGDTTASTAAPLSAESAHLFLMNDFPELATLDQQQTNLELADSYLRLGEKREACELLKEVLYHGTAQQKEQAQQLMNRIASPAPQSAMV